MKKVEIDEKLHNERLAILQKIEENERLGGENFFNDVEPDPPFETLNPDDVDYLNEKFSSKFKGFFARLVGRIWSKKVVKDLCIEVKGEENIKGIEGGAIITSNHFSIFENVAVTEAVKRANKKRKFYKIIREGNYFMPGLIGFLLKNERTLPISSNLKTMMKLSKAIDTLLKRGEFILVYPEKSMWWNYRKPRPFKVGAFHYAVKSQAPVVPCFVTMSDQDVMEANGFYKQKYTIHIMPPIYPDLNKTDKENEKEMMDKNYELCKNKYEEVYGEKLTYLCDEVK